ncbi:MAG: hypothetical protein IT445_20780 [Phycisphaeraceae bacterium]|nr:hypothetical protein [Phycisphaeraceae bacterium]
MSDNWIALVPDDPRFVPDAAKQNRARERFAEIAPEADEIEIKVSEKVVFFDCGGNFERLGCPFCGVEIPVEWWQERMGEDHDDGFKLAAYTMPCCGKKSTLNELVYEWPQAFGRFAIDAMNPNIGKLDDKFKREFEDILGTKLRVVYQHI